MPIKKHRVEQATDLRSFSDHLQAMTKGFKRRCPACGGAPLSSGYASLRSDCHGCGAHLEPFRADDAPAYFTIFLVGHIIVPLLLLVERAYSPETWVHMVLWLPLTLILSLGLLPLIKGALIGLQWSIGLRHDAHGWPERGDD